MRLDHPLTRLRESAAHLDPASIAAELAGLAERDWIPCPTGALGATAVPLVAVGGAANLDFALAGPVRPTPALARCPRLAEAVAGLGVPVSRCWLVRLAAGAMTPPTVDATYHGFRRASLGIPLVTHSEVRFECGGEHVHMAIGEVWRFDSSRVHRLCNRSAHDCVHLLVETQQPQLAAVPGPLTLEPHRFEVLSHAEVIALTDEILAELETHEHDPEARSAITRTITEIRRRWQVAFDRFGSHSAGELAYQDIIADAREQLLPRLPPGGAGMRAANILLTMLWMSPPAPRILRRPPTRRARSGPPPPAPVFERPVFVVSAPRAGSTLLFDLLARLPDVWTIGAESHELIRGIPELHPATRDYQSDRLTASDATPAIVAALRDSFAARLLDRDGRAYADLEHRPERLRLVEKTPANALRIPFLRAVFPGAHFIHLRREPRANISSLVEGWRSRRFIAYQGMPGWPYRDWSFLLPPGWEALAGRSLVEIATYQWHTTDAIIAADLAKLPAADKLDVRYEDLVRGPGAVLQGICEHVGLHLDERADAALSAPLAHTRVTVSAPAPDKWRRHEDEITAVLSALAIR